MVSASPTRRQLVLGGGTLGAAAWLSAQLVGHRPLGEAKSAFLGSSQRTTLAAAFEALLPDAADVETLVEGVDDYLAAADPVTAEQLKLALLVLEHTGGAGPLRFQRFSRRTRQERLDILDAWVTSRLGIRRQIATAVRKTVLFTYYAGPTSWASIGYDGPWVRR
jgi:hypothetical protein